VGLASIVWMSPIRGRSIVRALRSPYSGVWVVVQVLRFVWCVFVVLLASGLWVCLMVQM
jgi:hypothetical protein